MSKKVRGKPENLLLSSRLFKKAKNPGYLWTIFRISGFATIPSRIESNIDLKNFITF